jgi:Fur family ferric uptake transcriptional regulator
MPQRNTAQRRAIQDAFQRAGHPLGPLEVLAHARRHVPRLGIATVYRALKLLVAQRWLVPVALPGEPPRYEQAGKQHHHHFHCRQCGRVYEVAGCVAALRRLAPRGFQVTGHDLLLIGRCRPCRRAPRGGRKRPRS